MHFRRLAILLLFLITAATIAPLRAETLVALMSDKKLRYFSSTDPGNWIKTVQITGIRSQESLQALEFRPDGSLVVISREINLLRTYQINPNTGAVVRSGQSISTTAATAVGFNAFAPGVHSTDLVVATEGDEMTRFRFGSIAASFPPLTLAYDNSSTDGDPVDSRSGVDPAIAGLAGTNSFPGAESSVLYAVDAVQNTLVEIDWSTGSIDTVAEIELPSGEDLRLNVRTGFDISGATGIAYLANGAAGATNLYTLDLTTGNTEEFGPIGPSDDLSVTVLDISALPPSQLVNISTRSRVGTGEDVMIAGFITTGGASSRLIIRGLGPSLANDGVVGVLQDPTLTIYDGNGVEVASNDNWKSHQQAAIAETQLAPEDDREAAYVGTFPPGAYTAVVAGKNGGTGVGLVEIYRLD